MPEARLPESGDWPEWALVDRDALARAREERPFLETAAALAAEFGELTALLARAQPQPPADAPPGEARDAAVLRGLTVRIVKLTRRLAAETYEGRGDLQLLLDREIFVSTAALAYLLRGGGDRFEAFVRDGLRADRAVWGHLDGNRERRGGDTLPQEQRMRRRLARSFALAGVDPAAPEADGAPPWPGVEAQLAAIGEPDAHRMHQLGADAVHGPWNELITHHLRPGSGGGPLAPKLEWSPASVQPLTAVAIQGSRVMAAYARHLGRDVAEAFRDKYLDLAGRAALTDRLHEEYLERAGAASDPGAPGPPP